MRGLGLYLFGGLVRDLLLSNSQGLWPDCALTKEYLGHNLGEHSSEDTGAVWCLTYPSQGATFHRTLRSLVVRRT